MKSNLFPGFSRGVSAKFHGLSRVFSRVFQSLSGFSGLVGYPGIENFRIWLLLQLFSILREKILNLSYAVIHRPKISFFL